MTGAGIVIAGGGLAAQRCCERLRRAGYDGAITMICDEPVAPYDRPPLSKEFLCGEVAESPQLRADAWYADNRVRLRLGERAARLHAHERTLELSCGSRLRYDRLLIATGAAPRVLPGSEGFANVHVLRTLADAERLRERLAAGTRLAVIGGGFIGQEVTASARKLGCEATLIEAMAAPLAHIVGLQVGEWFAWLHRRQGVDVRLGSPVERLAGNGRVTHVKLGDGSAVPCDDVLVGIGVAPATAWLAGSGLDPAGVEIDSACRTRLPDVFAAGDCARGQHWEAAVQQGTAAAVAMLGGEPPALHSSSFWSDLYGVRINWLGDARDADDVRIDGDPDARDFTATYFRDGRPVAGLLVGRPGALPDLRRLLTPKPKESQ